jgi:hypothetical protein
VPSPITAHARATPAKDAVVWDSVRVSFAAFDVRATSTRGTAMP